MTYSLGDNYNTHNAILNKALEIGLNELHSKEEIQTLRANKIHKYIYILAKYHFTAMDGVMQKYVKIQYRITILYWILNFVFFNHYP